jgi:hypothetical protein
LVAGWVATVGCCIQEALQWKALLVVHHSGKIVYDFFFLTLVAAREELLLV